MKQLKLLLIGLGIFAFANTSIACSNCEVYPVNKKIDLGLNLRIDVDSCIDAGNMIGDFWSTQAIVYQEGTGNTALISQVSVSDLSGIIQRGNSNLGHMNQVALANYGLIYQDGMQNQAYIEQNLNNARAVLIQLGSGNYGAILQ